MRARQMSFYIEADFEEEVLKVVDEVVLPRYRSLPNFVAFILAKGPSHVVADGRRRYEVLGISVWEDNLDDSDRTVGEFRDRLHSTAGEGLSQQEYEVVRFE